MSEIGSTEGESNSGADASPSGADAGPAADAAPVMLADAAPPPCVEGDFRATAADGTCYWVTYSTRESFADSEASCASAGGHLAVVTDSGENDIVIGLAAQAYEASNLAGGAVPDYWIGATDDAVEDTFVWLSGETFLYENWRDNEPNNGGESGNEENCAIVEGDALGTWDDRNCASVNFGALCER